MLVVAACAGLALVGCSTAVTGAGTGAAAAVRPTPGGARPLTAPHHHRAHAHAAPTRPVHAGLFEGAGQTYGIGMPIIVRFTHAVTDVRPFETAVQVRVDGRPARGAWAWEPSPAPGWAVEAHYRQRGFWPAHSQITIAAPVQGVSAGRGLSFDDNLSLTMHIGAAHVSTVDASDTAPRMVVTSDGHVVRTLPVSLGTATNETMRGVKVVEEFDRVEDMEGTPVPWSVRLTNSGEFVHAAPWNSEIGRANLSHGCTNLSVADARWFYRFSQLGDVVEYPNAPGQLVPATDGFGDWNVSWSQWRAPGSL